MSFATTLRESAAVEVTAGMIALIGIFSALIYGAAHTAGLIV